MIRTDLPYTGAIPNYLQSTKIHPGLAFSNSEDLRIPLNDVSPGTYEVTLVVDSGQAVAEIDETNNVHTELIEVEPRFIGSPHLFVNFQTLHGFRPAYPGEVHVFSDRIEFTPLDDALGVVAHRAWLDRLFGSYGLDSRSTVLGTDDQEYIFVSADQEGQIPDIHDIEFGNSLRLTFGHPDKVVLADRAMEVKILQEPQEHVVRQLLPNGTVEDLLLDPIEQFITSFDGKLALSYEEDDFTSQKLKYHYQWLAEYGIKNPLFEHEDGTPIPATFVHPYYIIQPLHFSTIYTFASSNHGFTKEADRTFSEVDWDSGNGRISLLSDRRDAQDEIYSKWLPNSLTISDSFTISAKWQATDQGNWQGAFPLAVASFSVDNVGTDANKATVVYSSRDQNLGQNPEYYIRYHDESGVLRMNKLYTGAVATEYKFTLHYDSSTKDLTWKIQNTGGTVLSTASYTVGSNTGDGFNFGKILAASDGRGQSSEPSIQGWVDNIYLDLSTSTSPAGSSCDIPGPDAYGYTCSPTPYSWANTAGGTLLNLGDDEVSNAIALPFSYQWYGSTRSSVRASSNGNLQFGGSTSSTWISQAVPDSTSPNDLLACAWEDLDPSKGGTIRYKTIGAAPSRTFVVEFNSVPHYGSGGTNTFQFHLLETGGAKCMIQRLDDDADGASLTIGSESESGGSGVRFTHSEFATIKEGIYFKSSSSSTVPPSGSPSYSWNFDSGSAPDWRLTGLCHVSDSCANPPSSPYYLGYHRNSLCSYETGAKNSGEASTTVDLRSASGATLSFDHRWIIESYGSPYDIMRLKASTTGGNSWTTLRTWDSTMANQNSWSSESVSLTPYVGGHLRIQFLFDTIDGADNAHAGWHLDNVQVSPTTSGGGSGGGGGSFSYEEDFDAGSAAGWSYSGLWRVADSCSSARSGSYYLGYHRASNCDYDAGHTTGGAQFSVDLTAYSSAQLDFWHHWETESYSYAYDLMKVQVSTNSGSSWTTLKQWDSTMPNQYSWGLQSLDLNGYAGADLEIRFFFDSRDGMANDFIGWYIEDVEVSASGAGPSSNNPPTACISSISHHGMWVEVSASCSSDPDGDSLSYDWDWGDGTTSGAGLSQWHLYENRGWGVASAEHIGAYTVTLTVSDGSLHDLDSASFDKGPDDEELARYWAPIIYQDTGLICCGKEIYDEILRFDFDSDWIGGNNWGNAHSGDHRGYVYYSIHETTTDYYIGFSIFHPRDFSTSQASDPDEHENDVEIIMVVVYKDSSTSHYYGQFAAALSMAHNHINSYLDDSTWPSNSLVRGNRPGEHSGVASFDPWGGGQHIRMESQHGGHGIHNAQYQGWAYAWDDTIGDFRGDDGNIYYPDVVAETPGTGAGGVRGDDRFVRYKLLPLDSLWDRRYDLSIPTGNQMATYHHWGGLYGDTKGNHQAHVPWAIYDKEHEERWQSVYFEHPAVYLDHYYANFPANHDYRYVYRSTGGVAESWHAYPDAENVDSDGYDESKTLLWEWQRPGATQGRVSFGDVRMAPGDELKFRFGSSGPWIPATSWTTSAWHAGDYIQLATDYTPDGNVDWGWFVEEIQWN